MAQLTSALFPTEFARCVAEFPMPRCSRNAIHCQVWTAICAYLLVAIAKKEHGIDKSLYEMLQIVSVSAFEGIPLKELFSNSITSLPHPEAITTPSLLGF